VQQGRVTRDPIVSFFESIQNNAQSWISDVGPVRLGLIMTVLIGAALMMAYLLRRPSTPIATMSPFRDNLAARACTKCSTSAGRSASWRSTVVRSNESPT
jgi:hypothetical protein